MNREPCAVCGRETESFSPNWETLCHHCAMIALVDAQRKLDDGSYLFTETN